MIAAVRPSPNGNAPCTQAEASRRRSSVFRAVYSTHRNSGSCRVTPSNSRSSWRGSFVGTTTVTFPVHGAGCGCADGAALERLRAQRKNYSQAASPSARGKAVGTNVRCLRLRGGRWMAATASTMSRPRVHPPTSGNGAMASPHPYRSGPHAYRFACMRVPRTPVVVRMCISQAFSGAFGSPYPYTFLYLPRLFALSSEDSKARNT